MQSPEAKSLSVRVTNLKTRGVNVVSITRVSVIVAGALALASSAGAQDLPIVASHLVTGGSSRVELTNTSNQPATAWSLEVTTGGGGRTHRVVETIDAYLSEATRGLPGFSDKTDRLLPGQSRTIPLDPLPPDAAVRVTAVVLEDKTALGDADTIRAIFDRRAAERDELRKVSEIFTDVLGRLRGLPALEELSNRLSTSPQDESTPHRAAREAVATYLRAARAGGVDAADRSIREYAALVEREHALAVRHSR
jgi:hypothetical protein